MRGILVVAATVLCAAQALAAPKRGALEVPDPLKPWVSWVLHDKGEARCPTRLGTSERMCLWPSRLELQVEERGGRFSQEFRVDKRSLAALPGSSERWPADVTLDGKPAAVLDGEQGPVIELEPGVHRVAGVFRWDSLPDSLPVPNQTGLLALTLSGRPIPFPERDEEGRVWLRRQTRGQDEQERLEIIVHRKVVDEIPLEVHTRAVVFVAGKSREVLLSRALLEGFIPTALESPLPARVEPDGRLRVQVRPGKWTVELRARHDAPLGSLALLPPNGPWAPEEVWVFEARPQLRLVWIKGVPAIDPQQTTLDAEWKRLPAYRVRPGERVLLEERRRGDSDPPPDRLSLQRTLWLDFDGGGLTIADRLTGSLRRSWRLEMQGETQLGRVAIDGQDQFITVQQRGGFAGVEIREGRLDAQADSRFRGSASSVPAVGWNHDFYQVSGTLHLPPGWRLFHASGVDEVPETWIKSWSLFDLFLLLLISLAVGKLFGWHWAVLSLVTLGLIFPEEDAPRWMWLVLLALEALWRVLPDSWFRRATRLARIIAAVVLILFAVPFMVHQVRVGFYPVLSSPWASLEAGQTVDQTRSDSSLIPTRVAPAAAPAAPVPAVAGEGQKQAREEPDSDRDADDVRDAEDTPKEKPTPGKVTAGRVARVTIDGKLAVSSQGYRGRGWLSGKEGNLLRHDPNAVVQTGAGRQGWRWTELSLGWSGPVRRDQRLRLMLLSPGVNLFLGIVRFLGLALLCVVVTRAWQLRLGRMSRAAGAGVILLLLGALPGAARAQVPSPEILEELQERLLEDPPCAPRCAGSDRLLLEAQEGRLRLRVEIAAAARTAVPLPGRERQWLPQQVLLDGRPASAMATHEGQLWLALEPGRHQVQLEGALPDSETVQIALPLRPHRVEATVAGWRLEGLHEDGQADENLQLTRLHRAGRSATAALQPGVLPPFVRVQRQLLLGLSWQAQTTVTRLTPVGAAAMIEVPLLPGESITTAGLRVDRGRVLVNMGPEVSEVTWTSVLRETERLELKAPSGVAWSEEWALAASPIWHVDFSGLPPVSSPDEGRRQPSWRPWPGETLALTIGRPAGVSGQTLTIDHAALVAAPGLRATDLTLSLQLRSSRGVQHSMTLPSEAELQTVTIGGEVQPVRQEGRRVTLPLVPGRQEVTLTWRQPQGIAPRFVVPELDLGAPAVNVATTIRVPESRWVLLVGGPRFGPAVLFWSFLLVMLLVSLGLSRVPLTPLRAHHWLLLAMGLTQVPVWVAAMIPVWLLLMGWRQQSPDWGKRFWFDLRQLCLAGLTVAALVILCSALYWGLLGEPDMQIAGNGSSRAELHWFTDRTASALPRPWVISVPMTIYRVAMMAWALWLAWALIGWLRWVWRSFGEGALWRRLRRPRPAPAAPIPAGPASASDPAAPGPEAGSSSQEPPVAPGS